jgi:bacteriocin-like protein
MPNNKIINIIDYLKKRIKTHTLESAAIYPISEELSEEQLNKVVGGMSEKTFEIWRINMVNEVK